MVINAWKQWETDTSKTFDFVKEGDTLKKNIFEAMRKYCTYIEYMGKSTYTVNYQGTKVMEIHVVQ
jgi:hypothetical protein